MLWLPPAEHCVGGLGCGRELDGDHLRLQEGAEVQLPQELPLHTIVGGELDNYTCDCGSKKLETQGRRGALKKKKKKQGMLDSSEWS